MATTRLMALHIGKGRTFSTAIRDTIDYVKNPEKTEQGQLVTSYQCNAEIADSEFLLFKRRYIQKTGRTRGADDVIAYHLRQSFVPGEITPEEANRLGRELAMRFTKGNHAFIVCTHTDKAHIHNHIIFSAVTLDYGQKFRNFLKSGMALRRLNDTICVQNGYSIVENPKRSGMSYNKWQGDEAKPSHRENLAQVIDEALAQKPDSFEALLHLLQEAGYEVKNAKGKNPSLRGGGQKRFIRMDTIGPGYSAGELRAIIAGEQTHTPRPRKKAKPEKQGHSSNQLLIDIQLKLQEGKGAGYANWARRFNLKQMAHTMTYLQENGLMDYAVLSQKTAEASTRYNTLSTQIKAMETRMAEIAVLRTQLINYARTRDTYTAYRQAGYSKKFKAEHEADILLHQAAKRYFNTLNLKKLPSAKNLQAEYAELLKQKKAAYADYRKAREEMRELATAKANVEQILGKAPERGPRGPEQRQQR